MTLKEISRQDLIELVTPMAKKKEKKQLSGIRGDMAAVRERDPAAKSTLEILLCYPGLHALWFHRRAHWLYRHNRTTLARLVNRLSLFLTNIDIHPGARIGKNHFIDHGTGVVIGETAEIGESVTLYQGVTLGGTGKDTGKRHPTVKDNVVISAGARVLGPIEIGRNSKVGSGAVVIDHVPDDATVVGVPGRVVKMNGKRTKAMDLQHGKMPDPVVDAIHRLESRIEKLEGRLSRHKLQ